MNKPKKNFWYFWLQKYGRETLDSRLHPNGTSKLRFTSQGARGNDRNNRLFSFIRMELYLSTHKVCFSYLESKITDDIICRDDVEHEVRNSVGDDISCTHELESWKIWESSFGSISLREVSFCKSSEVVYRLLDSSLELIERGLSIFVSRCFLASEAGCHTLGIVSSYLYLSRKRKHIRCKTSIEDNSFIRTIGTSLSLHLVDEDDECLEASSSETYSERIIHNIEFDMSKAGLV